MIAPQHYAEMGIALLKQLIATPSLSREEADTADLIAQFLSGQRLTPQRKGNNIWVWHPGRDAQKPTLLLNSHHDTVKPKAAWTRDPFQPTLEGDILYGLGSNDAGGPLVSLIATFLYFLQHTRLPFNLVLAATAEEEISGPGGIAAILEDLGPVDLAIVGEPTQMHMAIAEKGLLVIDGTAHGKAGHAARDEGINALYLALEDIQQIRSLSLPKISPLLGPVKMTVTQIEAGSQHNVVPHECHFVIDVRTNECYTNQEVFEILQHMCQSELKPRSFRLNSSGISESHPVVAKGRAMGMPLYGSPTLSDQALIPYPSVKIGPGDSARSHTADEYIRISEIAEGVSRYCRLLEGLEIPFQR